MNIIGAFILLILIFVVLSASRRVALLAMVASVLYLTEGQQIDVFGFNFYAIRFLELAGFIRIMARREFSFRNLNRIDRAFLWFYGFTTVIFLLRSKDGVAFQFGASGDAFLCYFTFRGLIIEFEDFYWLLRNFIFLLMPYAMLVLFESATDHNLFTILNGIEGGSHWMRDGRPRCFGSFRQPDTLGMFAASFLPLYIGLACIVRQRKLAFFGMGLCLVIIWASNAGGAASAALVGLVCWGFWRYRAKMRKVRWTIVGMLGLLALMMKAPIWYIFARASSITGGDGWHRSYLIDVAYQHLSLWWFVGIPIKDTGDWMPYSLSTTGGADITNQYLQFGITAGLAAIILFIWVLIRAYSGLGLALAKVRSDTGMADETEFLLWGFGATLTIHVINWFGISYFDQIYVIWFMQLATISSLTAYCLKKESKDEGDQERDDRWVVSSSNQILKTDNSLRMV